MKGKGSIVKRGNVYYWRYKEINGKYTQRAIKDDNGAVVTQKKTAEQMVAKYISERQKIEQIESKVEYMVKVAEAKKIIQRQVISNVDIWQLYLESPNRPDSGQATLESYRQCLYLFLAHAGNEEITIAKARSYMLHLWGKGVSPRTYNKHLQSLKLVFRIVMKDDSPFTEFKAKPTEQATRMPFTPEQVNNIFKTLNNGDYYMLHKDQMRVAILLGLCFGLRLHDAACFRWDYIAGDIVTFKPLKTKRTMKKAITLPIPTILMEYFKQAERWRRDCYILPDVAYRYQYNNSGISQDINKLLESSGIQTREDATDCRRQTYTDNKGQVKQRKVGRYSFHSFRHTFCSIAANSGKDLSVIKSIVGHANIAMTEHYTHYDLESKRSVIDALPLHCLTDPHNSSKAPIPRPYDRSELMKMSKDALINLILSQPFQATL